MTIVSKEYMDLRVVIVVPVFNEAQVIVDVIDEIQSSGNYQIVVVDDGSDDDSYLQAKACSGVYALRHRINRGKGAEPGLYVRHASGAP